MNERLQFRIEEVTVVSSMEDSFQATQSNEMSEREDSTENKSDSSLNVEENENRKRKQIVTGRKSKKLKINRRRNDLPSDSDWTLPLDETSPPLISRLDHSASKVKPQVNTRSCPSQLIRSESPVLNPAQLRSSPGSSPTQLRIDPIIYNRSGQGADGPNPTPGLLSMCHDLTKVKLTLEQHSDMLQEILNTVRTSSIKSLARPVDAPEFPIEHKNDFAAFETWLTVDSNFMYMRSRVAAVGGTNVRSATMNMLKFLISNKIGMRFNWAGTAPKDSSKKRKQAFKVTKTYTLLNEAVKLSFSGRENADLTDYVISKAVQDWLKLSKSRYEHNLAPHEHLND